MALSGGCRHVREAVSKVPRCGVVALFDISASTDKTALKERYRTEFLEILEELSAQGVIVWADAIRNNPLSDTVFPIRIAIPKMTVIDRNEMELEDAIKTAREAAERGVIKLFSELSVTPNTRILDSIEVAARIFHGEEMKSISDRRLVIFSDMIESSERFEFTRIDTRRKLIAEIIDRERKAGRIPSLNGIRVWVAGAGAGGGSRLSGERLRWIEEFWLEYFRAAGADLPRTRYGSSLLDFHTTQ
jgi:hypothetical protein